MSKKTELASVQVDDIVSRRIFHVEEKLFSKQDMMRFARYCCVKEPERFFDPWFDGWGLPRQSKSYWISG